MLPAMKRISEAGSALFIILIAVVLFAALAYAVSNMMKGGNPNTITIEKSRLYGNEILNYARAMRQAAQNIKISNGCADRDISFENDVVTGYAHTPSVADTCQLFNNNGGGMVYQAPVPEWLDISISPAPALRGQWYFAGDVCVPGTGNAQANCATDGTDNEAIIAFLPYLKKDLCLQINSLLGITNPGGNPPGEIGGAWTATAIKYTGAQSDGEKLDESARMAGCFEGAAASTPGPKTYHFYQIIIPR
jgi:hypothetical protein